MSLFYKSMKIGTNAIYGMLIHNKLGKQKLAPGLYALKRKTNGKKAILCSESDKMYTIYIKSWFF